MAVAPEVGSRRLLVAALLLSVAFRIPLAAGWVGPRSDMVRYRWDGRVQTLGLNPFLVVPDQPAVAWTHSDETRQMPSLHDRTPYAAAAQLFFRGVVSVADSSRLMKAALVACDLLTIVVLLAWLRDTNRSPWLALVYAWNPLVILEVAHSGHIDALGSLWIAVSAWMLSTDRGMRDFGVRRALGATTGDVARLVVTSAARVVAIGGAVGLIVAAIFARFLATMLFGVQPLDPATFAAVIAVLLVTAALAIAGPAWRATRIDPVAALRSE